MTTLKKLTDNAYKAYKKISGKQQHSKAYKKFSGKRQQ